MKDKAEYKKRNQVGRSSPGTYLIVSDPHDCSRGFGLIEFIVVVAVMLIVTIAIARFHGDMLEINRISQEGLRTQQELRRFSREIAAELRSAQDSATGSYPLEAISTSSITFYSDVTGDRKSERLRYYISDGTLMRGETIPTGAPLSYDTGDETVMVVARYLVATSTPIFSYYDGGSGYAAQSLAEPIDISTVRMIGISVTVDKDAGMPPEAITVGTAVSIRSLKDNL